MNVREAAVSDARGMAKVHVDSWRTTYKGIVPDSYLNNLSYDERENMWRQAIPKGGVFVAESAGGKIVGFANGGRERSGNYRDYDGELYAIYILKEYQHRGVGQSLMNSVVQNLIDQGLNSMLVLVLEDNPSKYFYETKGGQLIGKEFIEIEGKEFNELVYGWKSLESFE